MKGIAMTNATGTPQSFLDQQVKLLSAGDTAGLAARYAPDAVFVRFDRVARGRDEVKDLFDSYVAENPNITAMDALQITEDTVFYQAAEEVDGKLTTAVGTLVFRDGLVWRQTVAFVAHRPDTAASAC
jgi:ketosteroid isomerase-like protein